MKNHEFQLSDFDGDAGVTRVQTPTARLLEVTKLSRLPQRAPFRLPNFENTATKSVAVVAVCAGCGGRLDRDDTLQLKFSGCRKCVSIYGRLDAAREENAKRETQKLLEKIAGGVK